MRRTKDTGPYIWPWLRKDQLPVPPEVEPGYPLNWTKMVLMVLVFSFVLAQCLTA